MEFELTIEKLGLNVEGFWKTKTVKNILTEMKPGIEPGIYLCTEISPGLDKLMNTIWSGNTTCCASSETSYHLVPRSRVPIPVYIPGPGPAIGLKEWLHGKTHTSSNSRKAHSNIK